MARRSVWWSTPHTPVSVLVALILTCERASPRCTYGARRVIVAAPADVHTDVWAGDWDGDGRADVAVATTTNVVVYTQGDQADHAEDLAFAAGATFWIPGGATGIAATRKGGQVSSLSAFASSRSGVFALSSNATATPFFTLVSNRSALAVAALDADGDGLFDVAAAFNDGISWYRAPDFAEQRLDSVGGVSLSATDEGVAVASVESEVVYFRAPLTEMRRTVVSDAFLDVRSVSASSSSVASGSYLDDTVAVAERASDDGSVFGAPVRVTESAHGVVDVKMADLDGDGDLDVVSACADDGRIRKHSMRMTDDYETSVVDSEAAGVKALGDVVDLDNDGALDVVAAIDGVGVVYYLNEDCVVVVPDDENDSSKKKKKSNGVGRNTVALVLVLVVALVACAACALFFGAAAYPETAKSVVDTLSRRRRRRRKRAPPTTASDLPDDDDDDDDDDNNGEGCRRADAPKV